MKEGYPFCLNCEINFLYPCFDFYHNISTRWSLTRMWSSEKANNLFLRLNWNLSSFWKSFEKKQFQTRISCFHRDFCHRVRSTCCCIQWMMPRITNRCLLWRRWPNKYIELITKYNKKLSSPGPLSAPGGYRQLWTFLLSSGSDAWICLSDA